MLPLVYACDDSPTALARILDLLDGSYDARGWPAPAKMLAMIRTRPPAAVVLDISLPEKDAFDILRAGAIPDGTPILAISGSDVLLSMFDLEHAARRPGQALATLPKRRLEELPTVLGALLDN